MCALINIDRHIVTDIVGLYKKIEKEAKVADRNWKKIMAYTAKEEAFICENDHEKFKETREKKLKTIIKADNAWKSMVSYFSESKALLTHIINRIEEIDTGKGKEYKQGENDES